MMAVWRSVVTCCIRFFHWCVLFPLTMAQLLRHQFFILMQCIFSIQIWDTRTAKHVMEVSENEDFISDMVSDADNRFLLATRYFILPCCAMSCSALPYPRLCPILPCPALPCPALPCPALLRSALIRHVFFYSVCFKLLMFFISWPQWRWNTISVQCPSSEVGPEIRQHGNRASVCCFSQG